MQGQSVPTYNFRSVLLNGIARLKLALRSRIWISPQAEAGATLGVADCVLLSLEYGLNIGRFVHSPPFLNGLLSHVYEVHPRKNHRAVVVIFAPAGVALGSAAADSPGMAFGSVVDFAAPLPATATRCSLCLLEMTK